MDNTLKLKKLLENAPDVYEGFVHGVLTFCQSPKIVNGLITYIEKHPAANCSQIIDKLDQLEGLKPLEND